MIQIQNVRIGTVSKYCKHGDMEWRGADGCEGSHIRIAYNRQRIGRVGDIHRRNGRDRCPGIEFLESLPHTFRFLSCYIKHTLYLLSAVFFPQKEALSVIGF